MSMWFSHCMRASLTVVVLIEFHDLCYLHLNIHNV